MQATGRLAALALALVPLVPVAAGAQQKRYDVDSYDVVLAVRPDGSYRVAERIGYEFRGRPFTYAERTIPLRYMASFTLDSIRAASGASISSVRATRSAGLERLRWSFPPTTGPATFTVAYTVRGALFESGGRDIVDWDAVGREWRVPMGEVRVAVLLPSELAPDSALIRVRPAEGRLTRTMDGWRIDYAYSGLPPRTAYRVVVDFPRRLAGRGDWPGVPSAGAVPWHSPLPTSYAWLLPLAVLAGFLPGLLLFLSWRQPRRQAVSAGAPPAALPRAAAILPEVTGGPARVFPAVIFDLAARGHLELRRVSRGTSRFAPRRVQVVVHENADEPLTPFEQGLLEQIRRYPTFTDFALKGRAYRRAALRALRRELLVEGLLEEHAGRSWRLLALAVASGGAGVATILAGGVPLLPAACALEGAAVGLLFPAALFRTPSESGALLRAQVQANLAWLRRRIEELARSSPIEAAQAYMRALPWLTLDARVTAVWVQRISKGLKHTDAELATPGWAVDLVGTAAAGSAAYTAFLPYVRVTSAVAAVAAPGSGAAGGAAGAGAGGGAGGGGGGAG